MLRDFVNARSRETQLGPVFDVPFWQRRLAEWPNFGIGNFYLAFNEAHQLLGCLAPWDSSSINRIVIEKLPASANAMRMLCNLLAPITRRPRIGVGPNSQLPDISLTHLYILDRRADVLMALLHAACADIFSGRRHATISLCLYDNDPLLQALRGYWYVAVPMDLFRVNVTDILDSNRSDEAISMQGKYPGFESYLV